MYRITADEMLQIADLYHRGHGLIAISKQFNKTHGSIRKALIRMGIPRRTIREGKLLYHDRLPNATHQRQGIVQDYLAGMRNCDISKKWGVTAPAIFTALRRSGVTFRKEHLELDETVFDTVTEESAYWTGFLMADGWVSRRVGRTASIGLGVAAKDIDHLRLFQRFLKTDYAISTHSCRGFTQHSLVISSDHIADALARFGVVPRKTECARVKVLADNRHFWRGVVDGDGSVCIPARGVRSSLVNCVGSFALMSQFQTYIMDHLGFRPNIRSLAPRRIWSINVTCSLATSLCNHLYSDCHVALSRKHDKATIVASITWKRHTRSRQPNHTAISR